MIKNKMKKMLQKITSNKMSALDWRLVYGIIEKDFKRHEVYANLPEELESKVSADLMKRINSIRNEVEEDKKVSHMTFKRRKLVQ